MEPEQQEQQQPANTLIGVALLGWMERDQAIRFLTEECVFHPALTESAAETLWQEWRNRAAQLPERQPTIERLPFTTAEQEHAAKFLQFLGTIGVTGVEVIKIDPLQLVVAQYHVATDRAADYATSATAESDWLEVALPTETANPDLNMNFTRRSFDTDIHIDLPHAEFIFGVHPHGGFGPRELLPYVSVMKAADRLVLGKGYHRLYARVATAKAKLPGRLSLVALDPELLNPKTPEAGQPPNDPGLNIFGVRPALIADFFTEGLALPVFLREKRYHLEIKARLVTGYA